MKFNKLKDGFTMFRLLLVIAIIGLLAAIALPALAQLAPATPAQYQTGQPNFFVLDTNSASYALTNNQAQTFTAGGTNTYVKTLRQNQGLSLFLAVWQTNSVASTTTNYTVGLDLDGDGSTWTMGTGARPITWTVPLTGGVGTNVYWTNIDRSVLNNVRKVQCTKTSTTASNNVFGALGYSQSAQ